MANLKGGNAVVRLLLAHGEKLGIAAVAVCAGMLIWSAIKHEHLGPDRQPEQLRQLATQASQHVENFTWDDLDPNTRLQAETFRGEAMAAIEGEHFPPIETPWTRPVLDPMQLRMDPELLTVEDLEVYGDSGMWASARPDIIKQRMLEAMEEADRRRRDEEATSDNEQDGGDRRERGDRGGRRGRGRDNLMGGGDRGGRGRDRDRDREAEAGPARVDGPVVIDSGSRNSLQGFEEIKAKSWVTVVAKVPMKKQVKLYDDVLMSASGYQPTDDVPQYRGYIVERAEVTDEGQSDWKEVARVSDATLNKTISFYPFEPTELVSGRYLHPLLTHPLPPLVLRDWDRRVTHSAIPLEEEDQPEDAYAPEAEPAGDAPAGDEDEFAMGRPSGEAGPGGGSRRFPGGPGGRAAMNSGGGPMESERGPMSGGGGSHSRRGEPGSFSWDGRTPYALFRYFDDQVEPGRRYRYRVQLAVADVNHQVPERFLDKTVSERRSKLPANEKVYRLTEWSEPSPIASVPLPARVYLVSAEVPTAGNFVAEPEAKILVQAFNSDLPAEIALEDDFTRGTVLNLRDKAGVIWVNSNDVDEGKTNQDFDFLTGLTVVDFRGGDKLSSSNRDLTAPAQVVLMDPAGRLFMQSELEDSAPVKNFQDALEGGADRRGGLGGGRLDVERGR